MNRSAEMGGPIGTLANEAFFSSVVYLLLTLYLHKHYCLKQTKHTTVVCICQLYLALCSSQQSNFRLGEHFVYVLHKVQLVTLLLFPCVSDYSINQTVV